MIRFTIPGPWGLGVLVALLALFIALGGPALGSAVFLIVTWRLLHSILTGGHHG